LEWENSFDEDAIFGACGALIWVCDAQEDYQESIKKFLQIIMKSNSINPNVIYEIFIHKVDGISDDHKIEIQREVIKKCHDVLHQLRLNVQISTNLTSIYDRSIFDAFSKVVQKLTPQINTLETLLDSFTTSSNVERAFLADIVTKIFLVADDQSQNLTVGNSSSELCSDMIDTVTDILSVYHSSCDVASDVS
jgi:Ras-related GTP-binding protein C/D